MFLLFGMRVVLRTIGDGTFHCPQERADRRYLRRRARRFFTLFFVPIIPLGTVGEIVECEGCHARFSPDVLTVPTSAQLGDHLAGAMRTLIVALLRLDGAGTVATRRAAVEVLGRYLAGATESWIDADLASIDPATLDAQMHLVGPMLEAPGRESLLANGVRIAAADGALPEPARDVLRRAGAALGMTPAHVHGTIVTAVEARRPEA